MSDYNALIRSTYPTRYIELDGEFLARGGTLAMFPDGLHPNCDGYTLMAEIVADALATRGVATLKSPPPDLSCS